VRAKVKSFEEYNPVVIGALGVALTATVALGALQYDKLPFINTAKHYSAEFAEAGGLRAGAAVQVAGYRVGEVTSIELDGAQVLVEFDVDRDVHLGENTEANIRTKSLLGAKVLEITPRGDGNLNRIPLSRTRSPYQLPDALGDLSATISGLNTAGVSDALDTLAQTFQNTPLDLKLALQGVTRFSRTLGARDAQLRKLLEDANSATSVLSERADEIAALIANTNALLAELRSQSAALQQISGNLSAFARQLSAFVEDNQTQLRPALDKLNGVITMVDNHKKGLQKSIVYLNQYALSFGEAIASGPFFKAYLSNLLPGQFVQPFVDAAFSDLGLDPNVLLPSERTDPEIGQRATPALPMPYPRTGQGGEPKTQLPDAITGNPGDQQCGPPGVPLPGPGCYPYRDPLPARAPGGPPPGPPAAPSGSATPADTTPSPVYQTAPGEPAQASQEAGR
jgi:phospholipid/cholesterol/gamma-HCH transport system substrate-binding protein